MPAANLEELFDFEGQFEKAAQAILVASGIAAYISQQAEKIPLLNTGIGFDLGPAIDELTQLAKPPSWPVGQPAPQEYYRYTGALEYRVEVPRDNPDTPLPGVATMFSQMRSQVRAANMRCVAPFTAANLPWYEVTNIQPNGTTTGFEAARNIDFCSLRFIITFSIKSSAWPAWVES